MAQARHNRADVVFLKHGRFESGALCCISVTACREKPGKNRGSFRRIRFGTVFAFSVF